MFGANSTPSQERAKQPRLSRSRVTAEVVEFEAAQERAISQRQFAKQQGLPRTTLQYWLSRKATIDADPEAIAFFESPVGLAFLHRLVIAAHLVFTQVGPGGIRLICQFLELSRLDRFVAASYGSQQKVSRKMEAEIGEFGKQERERLAEAMERKKISICQDETFHPETCLVAIEPVSGFILLEKYAEHRDAETWNKAIKQAIDGLEVEVIQSCSDEATGILRHVREELGAHHSPDLFHPQRELHKATSLQLESRISQASQEVEEAEKCVLDAKEEFENYRRNPPRGGFPPDFPKRIARAEQAAQEARVKMEEAQGRRDRVGEAIRGLSEDYHPYNLSSGCKIEAQEVERRIKARFAEIDRVAEEVQLSDSSRQRIEKARRLIESFVATIAFFHLTVEMWVKELMLSSEIEQVVLKELIPALYLQRASGKRPTAEGRAKVMAVYQLILERVRGPASALSKIPAEDRAKVERVAVEAADLFQRSSSCVEGRNGQLALRHHSLHRLSAGKLGALTVVHNYYLSRSDGTTAAERFFEAKPRDLFGWLVDRLDVPARPAAKRSKTRHKAA
jgi:Family of unknown function (DUF6399)